MPDRLPRRLLRRTLGDFAPLVAAVAQLLADAQTLGIEAQEAAAAVAVVCGIP